MADTKPFRVKGSFKMGLQPTSFTLETLAADKLGARERVLSTLGSRHRVDRHHIKIDDVAEISASDVTDPVIQYTLQKGA